MASTDARPIPRKNTAFRVTFPLYDADGDLITGASSLDSEVSKDGGTFADATSEATEVATSSGIYYLDLTADEMNADTVAVIVKTATSGAKTTVIVLYPEETGDVRIDASALATAAALAALNNLSSAQAQAAAAAALTAYDPPTQAELTAGLAAADDAVLAAIAARPSVADFWSGITATAARFIADHTLRRSWASAAVSANGDTLSFRSLLGAVAKLVNKVAVSGSTLTVYKEDDSTSLGTQTVTADAAAEPITAVDTVG